MHIHRNGIAFAATPSLAGEKACLLFLHGLQSRKEIFEPLRQRLKAEFPIPQLAVDFIGFGQSAKPENFGYDIADQAGALRELLDDFGFQRIHIIGHSLGGMLGAFFLKENYSAVKSLVSLEGNLRSEDSGESRIVASMSFDDFQSCHYQILKEKLRVSTEASAPLRQSSLDLIPAYVFYRTAQSIVRWSNDGALFNSFQNSIQPKLLVRGEQSGFESHPIAPGIEHATIPHSGHFMLLDNPEATSKVVADFLKRHASE
jgi:pimeloyl-ACP methyl ester carboxylesterase